MIHIECTGVIRINDKMVKIHTHDILDKIRTELRKAHDHIDVYLYRLSHPALILELVFALQRQVTVQINLDKSALNKKTMAYYAILIHFGANIRLNSSRKMLHHKMAIIDQNTLITGSYNWTKHAENSSLENIVILKEIAPLRNKFKLFLN